MIRDVASYVTFFQFGSPQGAGKMCQAPSPKQKRRPSYEDRRSIPSMLRNHLAARPLLSAGPPVCGGTFKPRTPPPLNPSPRNSPCLPHGPPRKRKEGFVPGPEQGAQRQKWAKGVGADPGLHPELVTAGYLFERTSRRNCPTVTIRTPRSLKARINAMSRMTSASRLTRNFARPRSAVSSNRSSVASRHM